MLVIIAEEKTPDLISNSEVKVSCADGSMP